MSISRVALVLLSLASLDWTRAQAQQLVQLADQGPRFYAVSATNGAVTDVTSAAPLRRRVALHLTRATIAEALAEVTRAAGLHFFYSMDALPSQARVSIDANDLTVSAALTEV